MRQWLSKLQIRLALWLLRSELNTTPRKVSESRGLTSDQSDPCHLFLDAAVSTALQIEELVLLLQEQHALFAECRRENPLPDPNQP